MKNNEKSILETKNFSSVLRIDANTKKFICTFILLLDANTKKLLCIFTKIPVRKEIFVSKLLFS